MFAYIPHGHCYLWQQELIWLHLLSDSAIAIAYYSIPLTLIYLVRKREDLPFNWIFLLFASFIVSCGTVHLLEVWTLWHPAYWISGSLKALTAVISCITAVVLLQLVPQILKIPSLEELESKNGELKAEVERRQAMEAEIRKLNRTLEARVSERTVELEQSQLDSERNRQQLQAILNNTTSIIYLKDLEGRLILINEGFTELFGSTPEQMLGMSDDDYLPAHVAEQTRANDQSVLAQRSPIEFEERVPINDVLRTYISVKFPLYDQDNNPYALGGISTDITDRKQAEEEIVKRVNELATLNRELHQTQKKLELQNQELDQFTYTVSHDLKAPLRAISNLSEWIEEDLEGILTEDTQKELTLLRDRVHRMDQMIQGLLEYSRVGRLANQRESIDVARLVEDVIDLLAPPAGLNIQTVLPMPVFEGERPPLLQVLMNLIGNAVKHHHRADGQIAVQVRELEQGYEFLVKDNGPGIKPENQERIFNIFESISSTQSEPTGVYNTGIGLAIVKKIVTRQGGRITLSSEVGEGTTFCFTWPIHGELM